MPLTIPTEEMETYRTGAAVRAAATRKRREVRRGRALALARQAAAVLREEYGARRVVVFGSVLSPGRFDGSSDLDLAVWGIGDRSYLRAVARLLVLDPAIPVDLVEAERAPANLVATIEAEGEEL